MASRSNKVRYVNDNEIAIFETPNSNLLEGAFINSLDHTHDTLILTSGTGLNIGGLIKYQEICVFLTNDSLQKPKLVRGVWSYNSAHGYLDLAPGDDVGSSNWGDTTGLLTIILESSYLISKVHFLDSQENVKILVIDTLKEVKRPIHDPLENLHDPFKKAKPSGDLEYRESIKLNSRGRPYRFTKVIYLEH
jgi:hypothetical protein